MAPLPGVFESAGEIELPGVFESAGVIELPGVFESAGVIELPGVVEVVPRATTFPGVVPADAGATPVKTAMATVATMSSVANDVRSTMILSETWATERGKFAADANRLASDHSGHAYLRRTVVTEPRKSVEAPRG